MKIRVKIFQILITAFTFMVGVGSLKSAAYDNSYFSHKIQTILKAQKSADFGQLADEMHELSLQSFRALLVAELDRLAKVFSAAQFSQAIGSNPEQLKALPDKDFFIIMCKLLRFKIKNDDALEPISVIGVLKEEVGQGETYHVVFRYDEPTVAGTPSKVKVIHADLWSFRRKGNDAKLWNIILTEPVILQLNKRLSATEQSQNEPPEPIIAR
jgi:hypothetical protein